MHRHLALLLLALAVALVTAPAAVADDNSVYQAWVAHDAKFAEFGAGVRKNNRSSTSPRKKAARLIELMDGVRKVLAENTAGVKGQTASSADGERGRTLALKCNARLDGSFLKTRKAMRLFLDGASRRKVDAYLDQADVLNEQASSYEMRARTAFKAAGVQIKDG